MQPFIPAIYFAGHAGPFTAYRIAAYAITVATSPDKVGMPKWRNNIVTMMPNEPDDNTIAALLTTVAQHGRAILLFLDHARFKAWQSKLTQVLA